MVSNAPQGFPKVSDSGYVLFYAIGGDGQPVGKPRLMFDDQTFENEKEIETYKARMKARKEPNYVRNGTGSLKTLTPQEASWLRYVHTHVYHPRTRRDVFEDVLGVSMAEIAQFKQLGDLLNPGSNPVAVPEGGLPKLVDELLARYA